MSTTQSRVAAGVPTGGQFATSVHAESTLVLDPEDALTYGSPDETSDEFAAVLAMARDSAAHWASVKGTRDRSAGAIDTDDVAQEAVLALLEAQANGQEIHSTKGYVHRAAFNVASSAGSRVRGEDRKALVMLNHAVNDRTQELGRSLTLTEKKALADEIRENWADPRHRPTKDFMSNAGKLEASLEGMMGSGVGAGDLYLHGIPRANLDGSTGSTGNDVVPGSHLDRALDAIEGHNGSMRDARRLLWNALAEVGDAPTVQPGTLSQRQVTAARARMDEYGGVEKALRNWSDGAEDAGTETLFAPWGDTDIRQRADIVNLMERHPDKAGDLWDSALKLANTRNLAKV